MVFCSIVGLAAFHVFVGFAQGPMHPLSVRMQSAAVRQSFERTERTNRYYAEFDARVAKQRADYEAEKQAWEAKQAAYDLRDSLRREKKAKAAQEATRKKL